MLKLDKSLLDAVVLLLKFNNHKLISTEKIFRIRFVTDNSIE